MKSLIWVTTLTKLGSEHLSVFKEKKKHWFFVFTDISEGK